MSVTLEVLCPPCGTPLNHFNFVGSIVFDTWSWVPYVVDPYSVGGAQTPDMSFHVMNLNIFSDGFFLGMQGSD